MKLLNTIIFSLIPIFLITSCEKERVIIDTAETDPLILNVVNNKDYSRSHLGLFMLNENLLAISKETPQAQYSFGFQKEEYVNFKPVDKDNTVFINKEVDFDILVYYPYMANANRYISFNLTNQKEKEKFNLMAGHIRKSDINENLELKHKMSKVNIYFNIDKTIDFSRVNVSLIDAVVGVSYDLFKETFQDLSLGVIDLPGLDWDISTSAVLVPHKMKIRLNVAGVTYDLDVPSGLYPKEDKEITYTIKFDDRKIPSLSGFSKDWVELGESDNKEISLGIQFMEDNPVIPFFTLENERNGKQVTYTYSSSGKKWNGSPQAFTASNTVEGDVFKATYIPDISDEVTGVKNVLQATSTLNNNFLPLVFGQVNSTLTLNIQNNTGEIIALKDIQVDLWGKYSISDFSSSQSILLEPQVIKKGSVIGISVRNASQEIDFYSNKIENDIVLEKNRGVSLILKLSKSNTTPEIDKIIIPDLDTEFTEEGYLVVNVEDLQKRYTYRYEGKKLIETIPYFYWSNFTGFNFHFDDLNPVYRMSAVFTPDAEGNPEKDMMVSPVITVKGGDEFGFSEFTHSNSLLEVRLLMGENYTNEEWEKKKKESTIILSGICSPDYQLKKGVYNAVIRPKIITNNDIIKLHIDNTDYTINLSTIRINGELLTRFEKDKSYVITVTIDRLKTEWTAHGGVAVAISDWGVVEAKGSLKKYESR